MKFDPYPEFSTKPELFDRPSVRLVLFVLIPGMIFALVSAAIRVSEYGIDHTILVYGDNAWVSGNATAVRISLMADDGRFFLPEKITAFLKKGERRHLLFNDAVSDRGHALGVNFRVPEVQASKYLLELDIRFDERRRKIEIPIEVATTPPQERLEIPKDTAEKALVDRARKGRHLLRVFTEDRGAPTGITSTAFVRVTDRAGAPAEMPIAFSVQGRDLENKKSDKLGLLALSLTPMGLDAPIAIQDADPQVQETETDTDTAHAPNERDAGPADAQTATLYPNVVYAGVALSIHNPIVALKERVKVTIEQVSKGGPVYANLFHNGRWVQASSGFLSDTRAVMEIRPEQTGLFRLQLSNTAIGAGDGVAVRHFYVLGPDESPIAGLRSILEKLRSDEVDGPWASALLKRDLEQGGFDYQKAAAFALSRLYNGHRHPPQLISSRLEDDKELTAFKTKFQRMMMMAIIALGLGVSCFIGLFALAAHRRQQRISKLILSESDDEGDGDTPPGEENKGWQSRTGVKSTSRVIMQGAVLFFIVLGAFIAIALLVDTLTWSS